MRKKSGRRVGWVGERAGRRPQTGIRPFTTALPDFAAEF
jgi:hypothetical protein